MNRSSVCHTRKTAAAAAMAAPVYEADVCDPRFADPQLWKRDEVDVVLHLSEMDPGDPGELSGADLRLTGSGDCAVLTPEFGHHVLGILPSEHARQFVGRALASFSLPDYMLSGKLAEFYGEAGRFSGAELHFEGGPNPSLQVRCGEHVFGLAQGASLREFLNRAFYKASTGITEPTPEAGAPNVVCISKARRPGAVDRI